MVLIDVGPINLRNVELCCKRINSMKASSNSTKFVNSIYWRKNQISSVVMERAEI